MQTPIKSITVRIEQHYGKNVIVPVCVNAQAFANIAKTKLLSKKAIGDIQSLGYHVNIQQVTKTLHDVT